MTDQQLIVMEILKVVFCASMAFGSLVFFWFAQGKSWEERLYKQLIGYTIVLKFCACLVLYLFYPSLVTGSDALAYYKQAQWYLSGQILYYDINTPYSLLFLPFLSLPVRFWDSVGAIVLTMLAMETVMLLAYFHHYGKKDPLHAWRVGFLYSFSPISFYWVALTGYNGIMIAFFGLLGLILADKGESILSGLAASMGFLLSKLLAILAWPAIVFYDRVGWIRRGVAVFWPLSFLAVLPFFKINPLRFLEDAFLSSTSGNLWFLITQLAPEFSNTPAYVLLPLVSFNLLFWPLFVGFIRARSAGASGNFDAAIAFVAATNLLFMVVSRKSYTFYMPMALIFVVHSVTRNALRAPGRLLPLAFLGATTTVELHLYQFIRRGNVFFASSSAALALFFVDLLIVGCYLYLLIVSTRIALRAES